MQANRKIVIALIWPAILSTLPGCSTVNNSAEGVPNPQPSVRKTMQTGLSRKFAEPGNTGPTAVESAIELSEKYASLAEKAATLQKENQNLLTENTGLNEQLTSSRTQLAQTQKELTEANDLLVEMRIELNNWKTDILGFRDEMREADKAQLEALVKVLKALGGQLPAQSAAREYPDEGAVTENDPNEPPKRFAENG